MKNLLLLSLILLSFYGCREKEDTDPNVLPPATQTGANTAGALVNGEVWVATTKFQNTTGGNGTRCEKIGDDEYRIQLGLKHVNNLTRITIIVEIENFQLNTIYEIPPNKPDNIARYLYDDTFYIANVNTGKIKITRLDIPHNIVSGTFEFDAINPNTGEVIHITEGRFDKKFD